MNSPATVKTHVAAWKMPSGQRIRSEVFERIRRRRCADHVVPLQDLVEHDPVEETA